MTDEQAFNQLITAATNPKFKLWQSLLKSSGIKEHGLFFLYGEKLGSEVYKQNPEKIKTILHTADHKEDVEKHTPSDCFELSKELFKELDVFGIRKPIFVCEVPEIKAWKQSEPDGLELFLALQDPSNLGAILRSALNFDVSKVILLKECSHPCHPKAIRALSSNPYSIKFESGPAVANLEVSHKNFFALDMIGTPLKNHKWPKDCYLLLGEEGQGVPNGFKTQKLGISVSGKGESLNATVAASIALADYFSKSN